MGENVGIATRMRIFVVSTGFVAALAGGGALYVTVFSGQTTARVGALESTSGQHTEQIGDHEQRINTNTSAIAGHATTLGEHGDRIGAAEAGVTANADGVKANAMGVKNAADRAGSADATSRVAVARAETLAAELEAAKAESAVERQKLVDEIALLREKLDTADEANRSQFAEILERLSELEKRVTEKP